MRAPEEQRAFMREYMKNYNHGVTLGLRRRHPTLYGHSIEMEPHGEAPAHCPVKPGQAYAWMPSMFVDFEGPVRRDVAMTLSGRVIYVNEEHRYYTVEAPCNGHTLRESFKF